MRARAVVLALVLTVTPAGLRAQTSDVALGIEALARRDVRAADAAFARASTGPEVLLRSSGFQWRGHLAWKVRGDTAAAVRYLQQALATARDSSMVMLEIARLSGARGRYREAVRTAYEAMQRSGDAERRGLVARTLVELAADGAFAAKIGAVRDSVDSRILSVVQDTLAARVRRFQGRTMDASALMKSAAMLGDSAALRAGWASYDLLGSAHFDHAGSRIKADMHRTGITELVALRGQIEVAALAIRSATQRAGVDADTLEPWARNVVAYSNFIRHLRRDVEQYYRNALSGRARTGDVQRAITLEGKILWGSLHFSNAWNRLAGRAGRRPEFYPGVLVEFLDEYFGARLTIERSDGVEELHYAHVRAGFPEPKTSAWLLVLDGEVANGFDGWLLDGAGGRAGWVKGDTIFERRIAFTETPFRAWLGLNDPQSMPGEAFRIARDSVGDIARARRDSLGFFPGVAARIFRDGALEVATSFRDGGPSDSMRLRVFSLGIFRVLELSSINMHEGRHILDSRTGHSKAAADDEFRAKIDEVTGATFPKLALTAILSPNIGDPSSHGQANRRVMRELNRWIRMHGKDIVGYDAQQPALLQLPLLSSDQLRAAFASMKEK
jgi:hypothetical protein